MLASDSLLRAALPVGYFRYSADQSFELNTNHRHRFPKSREVDVAQKLEPGKYIKEPYSLEKIGLAIKEDLGKMGSFWPPSQC